MTRVRAFRALRYDPKRVELSRVIAPPYDVVAPEERAAFYARDPHNALRLELTRSVEEEAHTDYTEIRLALDAWRREGILALDPQPALYGLRQRFSTPEGTQLERRGFFAELRLEDYDRGVVLPHERTLAAPKADRLKLLRTTRANLSSVLLLYEDRDQQVEHRLAPDFDAAPLVSATDAQGVEHTLLRVSGRERIEAVRAFMATRPVVIADGHHRYETALAYRDERRAAAPGGAPDAPHEWILACFANSFSPGTLLLPIHRLIRVGAAPGETRWADRLPGWSRRSVELRNPEQVPALLAEHLAPLRASHAFAADDASGRLTIFSKPSDGTLTLRVIHREVIGQAFGLDEEAVRQGAIEFPKDAVQTAREVRSGRGAVALYLNPLAPDDVFRVTASGERLPQKSTFFYPKLPTGLVFRLHEDAPA